MKTTITFATLIIVFLTITFVEHPLTSKIRIWSGVVAEDVESQIDELLGKERVMRQQAVEAIHLAQADIQRLQELAISSSVDAGLMTEKLDVLQAQESKAKEQLVKLGTMITQGQPVALTDGTVWQIRDLEAYAETKIVEYETIQQRIETLKQSKQIHEESAVKAETALLTARQNVSNMQAALELLDAKIGLLTALEAQPVPMSTGDPQVSAILSDTENLLDSLLDEVEREIRIAKERQALQKPGLSLGALEIDSTGITNTESDIVDRLFALSNND